MISGNAINIPIYDFQVFLVILVRVAAIFFSAPIFGSRRTPIPVKAALSLMVSMTLFPVLQGTIEPVGGGLTSVITYIGSEIMIGLVIGFSARLIFGAVQLSGMIVGFQMGLGMAQALDPSQDEGGAMVSRLQDLVAVLIFLSLNGHHIFIMALVKSFQLLPPMEMHYSVGVINMLVALTGNVFVIALKVSAPAMAALFFTNVALGIVAKTVPQMNVLIVGLPLQIAVGMMILAFSFPFLVVFLKGTFSRLNIDIMLLMKAM